MPEPIDARRRYVPGLDGLRAIAVVAVLLYHLDGSLLPGGLLGVGVFFTLSGYLITDVLLAEWDATGRIRLRRFWIRRARRLLPALACLLLAVLGWAALAAPGRVYGLPGQVLAVSLYVSNWWDIFARVPYFARFGSPSPLGHLWSLAVEEQFYLLWPFLLLAAARRGPRRAWLAAATLGLAAASALAMAFLYVPGGNPDRVYYGTDTRAFALLIGAALAMVRPSRGAAGGSGGGWPLQAGGAGALAVVVGLFAATNAYQPWMYRGGMVLLSVAAALVIAAAAVPGGALGRLLGARPLRWLGIRSYAIYLWHYPIIVLTAPAASQGQSLGIRAAAQVAATLLIAAASWRWVEDPIRRRGLQGLGATTPGVPWTARPGLRAAAGALACIVAIDAAGLLRPLDASATGAPRPAAGSGAAARAGASAAEPSAPSAAVPDGPAATSQASAAGAAEGLAAEQSPLPAAAAPPPDSAGAGNGVSAIGDSIMLDVAPYLRDLLPGIAVDGTVGEQLFQAPADVAQLRGEHLLGSRVVLELGTNGPFTAAQLTSVIQDLGPVARVVLVNTREPRAWQDVVNRTIQSVAAATPGSAVVDWYGASAGHPEYFYGDGVHLNPAGAAVLATLIADAVYPGRTFAVPATGGG